MRENKERAHTYIHMACAVQTCAALIVCNAVTFYAYEANTTNSNLVPRKRRAYHRNSVGQEHESTSNCEN